MSTPARSSAAQIIPRLTRDDDCIPESARVGATHQQRTIFDTLDRQHERINDIGEVLNAQSQVLEQMQISLEPFNKAMGWWAVTRWLIIGFFGFLAAVVGFLYAAFEALKSWRSL